MFLESQTEGQSLQKQKTEGQWIEHWLCFENLGIEPVGVHGCALEAVRQPIDHTLPKHSLNKHFGNAGTHT